MDYGNIPGIKPVALMPTMSSLNDGAGRPVFTLDDFCDSLQAPPSCVKHYGSLKRRIIDPAVRELRDKDGWLIDWRPTRSGSRKITGMRFDFGRSQQQRFELTQE